MELNDVKKRLGIIGNTPALNNALEVALRVAATDLSVLITGESGVGKEFFPQIIHQYSPRKHNTYIAVNCGAIPEGTIDSELFGHEKGSFTGAHEARKGYFEVADGGTIFLDEVAELPLTTQVRLLRVLQTGEFIRVGSSVSKKTNVRVVAATNVNLHTAIESGRFREDLYYRLNTVPIFVPPLRERKGDIYMLFRKFASDIATQYRMPTISLTPEARLMLENYSWSGNIRQLKNVAEQISAIEQQRDITPDVLRKYLPDYNPTTLPILVGRGASVSDNSERDILYKLLFDLRGEVSELKAMIRAMGLREDGGGHKHIDRTKYIDAEDYVEDVQEANDDFGSGIDTKPATTKEESLRRQIMAALAKHEGNRRAAAAELFVSERTLYRKIKELGIE
ncbi:Transcriptional regulator [Mucinivorans hirudinis]|uniref:Transcriptional regulator n=1 Tax=Mucinivorans hirudinis TaxID=1433126 RepID=A0A060R9C2_9BACT|nr:Transcriptional regulator [Mucinivorans hirudinis]